MYTGIALIFNNNAVVRFKVFLFRPFAITASDFVAIMTEHMYTTNACSAWC